MPVKQIIEQGLVPVLIYTDDIEAGAREQLVNLSRLPIIHHHVAAMPDVHAGIGATVGTVIATKHAIIPAAVGVDIGCGMIAACTSLTALRLEEKSLKRIFEQILRDVPVGREQHRDGREIAIAVAPLQRDLKRILDGHPQITQKFKRANNWMQQMGTLGGGNHFIEVCIDESERVWVMLHSGSRGIGNAIGTYFIELARRDMERQISNLPDRDLAYLS
jgi:tRNA-splicing ligase RtcB